MRKILILIILFFFSPACRLQADCDINEGPCRKNINKGSVILDIYPRPVRAMRELQFSVHTEGLKNYDSLKISLSMPGMYMGKNEIMLLSKAPHIYEGRGVIPRCASGKTLWQADIFIPEHGIISFRFNVR
ncbi:MAG: hypothetical protein N2257_05575 [Thermodesulfovibrionales bacterium]|nr:hypothetical protein [Thermodesulfovibrionales bacterium]